jgi:hypothetical protein
MSRSPLAETVNLTCSGRVRGGSDGRSTVVFTGCVAGSPPPPPQPATTSASAVIRVVRKVDRVAPVKRLGRIAPPVGLAAVALLALAPVASAADGVGLYGRTDDKVVTFFAFGVIGFFALLVITLSLLQIRLENRKDRAREELERLRRP